MHQFWNAKKKTFGSFSLFNEMKENLSSFIEIISLTWRYILLFKLEAHDFQLLLIIFLQKIVFLVKIIFMLNVYKSSVQLSNCKRSSFVQIISIDSFINNSKEDS